MDLPIAFLIRSASGQDAETLRNYAERRLAFALRRFENGVRRDIVRFGDDNGPRRGVDCRCSLGLQMRDGRHLDVEAVTAWPFASITLAARRLNAALRRQVEKQQLPTRRCRPTRRFDVGVGA